MTHFRCVLALLVVAGCLIGTGSSAVAQDRLPSQAVGMVPTAPLAPAVKGKAWTATRTATGKAKGEGLLANVGMELALLYYQHEQKGAAGVRALRTAARTRATIPSREGRARPSRIRVPVSPDGRYVTVEGVARGQPERLRHQLRRLGLKNSSVAGNVVSGQLPVAALREAAQLSALRGMMPSYVRTAAGSVDSEADTSHGVFQVREERRLDGAGEKVCALSDSYNRDFRAAVAAPDDVQSGDLPGTNNPEGRTTPVDVLQDTTGTDEGRAMLQLIHDLAPGATLGFHTALGGLARFAEGIRSLADPDEGDCTILVDDIGYSVQPFYQDGPVSNAVDEVVEKEGVTYFSAAGNLGESSYEAPFRNSGQPGVISQTAVRHDFDPSSSTDTRQAITVESGGTFQIFSFQWTDPSSLVEGSAGADTDLDIALVNGAGTIVAESSQNNLITGVPAEVLSYQNTSGGTRTLNLIVEKAAGPDPDRIKYVYTGAGFEIDEYVTRGPTIFGHPMAEKAMAVAAAAFYNTAAYNPNIDSSAVLNSFSSKGGLDIRFDSKGAELGTPKQRQKPEVTGTDFIDNTFFGTDTDQSDGDAFPNFAGTSAAAPNVAAIAALIQEARPDLTPTQVYDRLETTALDVTERGTRNGAFEPVAEGPDPWSGYGFVDAARAVPPRDLFDLQIATTDASGQTLALSWTVRDGVTIQRYDVDRRYFGEAFVDLAEPSGPPLQFDSPGLGAYTYRIQWTRSDGIEGQRRLVDTLGFQGADELALRPASPDENGRRTVQLRWEVPPGPRTADFSYRVERKAGTDGPFESLATTSETRFEARRQSPGQYSYRVTARDGAGNALISQARGLEVAFEGAAVAIGPYPNPSRSTARIDLTTQEAQTVAVEVYNTLGQRVYRARREIAGRTATPLIIDVGRWGSGVYVLRLRGDEFTKTRKIVVRR